MTKGNAVGATLTISAGDRDGSAEPSLKIGG